jgi:dTDP-4-amino-4,6-dideoxygalactose transaminase
MMSVAGELPHATDIMRNGFSVGCHQDVSAADVAHVTDAIAEFLCAR